MVNKEYQKINENWNIQNKRKKLLSIEKDIMKMEMMKDLLLNTENIYASAYSSLEQNIQENIKMLEEFKENIYKD